MLSYPIDGKAAKAKFFSNRFWGEICKANLIINGLLCKLLHKNIYIILRDFGLFINSVLKGGYNWKLTVVILLHYQQLIGEHLQNH